MMVLFLNDISGSEVLLILVFVLMFFGSKSIPGLARTLGRTMRQIKDASGELQNEIRKSGVDIKKDLNLTGLIEDTAREIQQPLDQYVSDLDNAVSYQPPPRPQAIPAEEAVQEVVEEVQKVETKIVDLPSPKGESPEVTKQ